MGILGSQERKRNHISCTTWRQAEEVVDPKEISRRPYSGETRITTQAGIWKALDYSVSISKEGREASNTCLPLPIPKSH